VTVRNPETSTTAPRGTPGALTAVALGFFIVMLDTTIVNVALPRIGTDLHGGVSLLQWVVDSYTLVFAALLLTTGAACDILGARRIYLSGLAVFAIFSACCALAPTGSLLIGARAMQGIGAAALVPGSLALLAAAYPNPGDRAKAIGIWGGVGGIAAAAGPVLGGALITAVGWRAVFWVNLPVVAIAAWLTMRHTPNPAPAHRRHLDLPGQASAILALCAITYAVIDAAHTSWSPRNLITLLIGVAAAAGFVLIERAKPDPMLPLTLFENRSFSVASFVGLALNLGFYGQFFVLTLYFQQYRGYGPLTAGLALAPQALGAVIGSPLGGRATARFGAFATMLTGLLIGAAAFAGLLTFTQTTPYVGHRSTNLRSRARHLASHASSDRRGDFCCTEQVRRDRRWRGQLCTPDRQRLRCRGPRRVRHHRDVPARIPAGRRRCCRHLPGRRGRNRAQPATPAGDL